MGGLFTVAPTAVATPTEMGPGGDEIALVMSDISRDSTTGVVSFSMACGDIEGNVDVASVNFNIIAMRQGSDYRSAPQPTAAVIKPAVAIGKGMFANGTNGGNSGTGTYAQRKLNVWSGETWFVSGFDGTLGAGGTTDQFDLDPGTYKIHGYTTAYKSNGSFSLLDTTDNEIQIYGGNGRPGSGDDVNVLLPFSRTITINEKKTFKLWTWTTTQQTTYGLGVEIGTSTGAPAARLEQYSSITIEKLK